MQRHRTISRRVYCMALLACLTGASHVALARIYKWVDANGNVQYTQTPPPGGIKAKEIKAPPHIDSSAAVKELEQQQTDLDKKVEQRAKTAEKDQQAQQETAEKQQKCDQARLRLSSFERPRVRANEEDGVRRKIPEEERTAEMEKARAAVQELCK